MITTENLINILTRYEGAVQAAIDESGDEAVEKELEEARNELLVVLREAKEYCKQTDHSGDL
ncbi:Uncharacterised protein [uncultured archaeon]|nr:Uncharacterised protein [uncultured archaeon]